MMLVKPLELDVIMHSNQQDTEKMIDEILEGNTQKMTFYLIQAISPFYLGNGHEYTNVHCFGNNFLVAMPYKNLKEIINETNRI